MNSAGPTAVGVSDYSSHHAGRMLSLDVLRGLAVLLVLGNHLPRPPDSLPVMVRQLIEIWKRGGWVGVDLFFVLSGFLVSGLLMKQWQKTERVHLRRFLYRRGLKIYPAFYAMLFTTSVAAWLLKTPFSLSRFLSEFFFLQSYFPRIWNHTWSLAVEEHFYIGIAIGCASLLAFRKKDGNPFHLIPMTGLGISILCLGMRVLLSLQHPYSHDRFLIPTHLRVDSLFFGVVLAYFYHFRHSQWTTTARRFRWWLIALAIAAATPAFVFEREGTWYFHTIGFTLLYIGFGALLFSIVTWPTVLPRWTWMGTPIALVGFYSYSIYLWHMPTLDYGSLVLRRVFHLTHYGIVVSAYLIGSIVLGILFSKLIELPVLAWRDRVVPPSTEPS